MLNRYDIAYSVALGLSAPFWLVRPAARRKVLVALRQRMGDVPARSPGRPAVLVHAVSLGEMNATPALIETLRRQRPGLEFVVSTTTEAGHERARQLYGDAADVILIRYPLDFTRGVRRVLDRLRPTAVVLMELEVWPNFLRHCQQRGIPVILANGRVSERSYRHYKWARPVAASMLRRLARLCVQDASYAEKFVELGAPPDRVMVAGTMKFDTAQIGDRVSGDGELAEAVGLFPGPETIWVCGSTGPGEEEAILRVYRGLLPRFPGLRLVIVPRHKARFDEVATLIEAARFSVVRRSRDNLAKVPRPPAGMIPPVVLGDTMGELRAFYSLADVVFVGRSLVDLGSKQHGSDMIEPAALGRPVVVGPYTGNFADAMLKLRQAEGVLIVAGEAQLAETAAMLLAAPEQATAMGRRAQDVCRREQGATGRHATVILEELSRADQGSWPAILK